MKANTRLSVGLIFALVVVGLFFILRSGWIQGSSVNLTPTVTPRPAFLNATPADLRQIQVVDTATKERFVVRHADDGTWEIVEAKKDVETKYGPDQTRIDNAVTILASISANRTINEIEALAQFGLDKPVYQIILTDRVGDTTISVGAKNPDETSYYTQKSGSREVFLISTFNLDSLIDFLADPPYLTATPVVGLFLSETPVDTETPSGSPTAVPTLSIKSTLVITPRATETPTPTATYTPSPSKTPGPSPTATATPK